MGAEKWFTLFISNGDMNDIKIIKSLEDSGVLIDRVTETEEGGFIGALLKPLAASIVQPVIFSVVRGLSGTGAKTAGRWYMDRNICRFFKKQFTQEVLKKIKCKLITHNIFRIQDMNLLCVDFIVSLS